MDDSKACLTLQEEGTCLDVENPEDKIDYSVLRTRGKSLRKMTLYAFVACLSVLGVYGSLQRSSSAVKVLAVGDDVLVERKPEIIGGGPTLINTKSGPVQGFATNSTVAFLGIPYAKAPVGELRFESPFPNDPWTEVLNATEFSAGCPQDCQLPEIMCPLKQSEDCLYLNVYTPDKEPPEEGWPVYVFIHGGAFQNGEAGTFAYVGFGFAQNDVILVAMNYRLGAFGFLNYGDIEGNYGFQDQIRALQWVQDNIGSFGGDNTRVTLGGESAGAVSVMCHLVSPLSQGLFSKAIIESSPLALPFSKKKDNRFYSKFVSLSNCKDSKDVKTCLRALSSESIVKIMDDTANDIFPFPNPDIIPMPWTPSIGTVELPEHPYISMKNKQMSKVPVLVGGNLEDARIFVYGFANFTLSPLEYYLTIFG